MTEQSDKRTIAPGRIANGMVFHCYRTDIGIFCTEWRNADRSRVAGQRYGFSTYYAAINGVWLSTRFRSLDAALRAAAKGKPGSAR